jgi:hypothetical protein
VCVARECDWSCGWKPEHSDGRSLALMAGECRSSMTTGVPDSNPIRKTPPPQPESELGERVVEPCYRRRGSTCTD